MVESNDDEQGNCGTEAEFEVRDEEEVSGLVVGDEDAEWFHSFGAFEYTDGKAKTRRFGDMSVSETVKFFWNVSRFFWSQHCIVRSAAI